MLEPLVSCLVTASNDGRFLERAVASALAQDYPALEVVIVDDGSTDGAGAAADALAAKHDNVRAIHQGNGGRISAFNRAIAEARGELYAILDGDDTWLPGKLRKQVDLLHARPELGLVYSDLAVIDEHDDVVRPSVWADESVHALDGRCAAGLVIAGNTAKSSSIVVRASLRDVFFPLPDDVPYGDWWIAFRIACVAPIAFVDEPLVGHRRHGSNPLEVHGDALAPELRKEHQFRRVALARLEPGVLTVAETVRAHAALEASRDTVRAAAGTAFSSLPDRNAAAVEQELALAGAAEPVAALRMLLRAVALDPWNAEARARFVAAAQGLADRPNVREERRSLDPEFVALSFLDEIVDTPDLLADYARAFGGKPGARLVVLAPGQDAADLERALTPVAQALGLDREDSADVLVVTAERAGEQLAPSAAAVYTRVYRNSYLSDVPQVGTVDALLRMAEGAAAEPEPAAVPVTVAIGFLEEVAAEPDLLADFANTFDGRDDTRLVLLAPEFAGSEGQLEQALVPFTTAVGLDREGSADVVVLTDPSAGEQLAPTAAAVYSRVYRDGCFAHLPPARDASDLLRLVTGGGDRALPERAYPGVPHAQVMRDHVLRYAWALETVAGLHALDLGCGTGSGTAVLGCTAASVKGFDLWRPASGEAPSGSGAVSFTWAHDLCSQPLPSGDVGVMFEVLEHLEDGPAALERAWTAVPAMLVSFANARRHGSDDDASQVNDWPLDRVEHELVAAATRAGRHAVEIEHWHQLADGSIVPGRDGDASCWLLRAAGHPVGPAPADAEPGAAFSFRCNVCDTWSTTQGLPERERQSCERCGSTARWRSVVHALSTGLFGQSLSLPEFPTRPDLTGVGLTDWQGYAEPLAEKLSYRNTFLHMEPRLDVTEVDSALEGTLDFVIASEVFEHVDPPVERAFETVRRLLKPGGVLVLTVPYVRNGETREHFPELHDWELVERDNRPVLVNRTEDGRVQEFEDLRFHGGPGATLELRLFAESTLVEQLHRAGFEEVTVCAPMPEYGIVWRPDNSWPVIARTPMRAVASQPAPLGCGVEP